MIEHPSMEDFNLYHTGGGCTALSYDFGDGRYLLVTDLDGSDPKDLKTPIYVGLYGGPSDLDDIGAEVHEMDAFSDFLEVW